MTSFLIGLLILAGVSLFYFLLFLVYAYEWRHMSKDERAKEMNTL